MIKLGHSRQWKINQYNYRTVPNDAEDFGTVRQIAERKENHTLTVRETARMFEAAGVARAERSIINWCQPNRQGIARLDSYYDPNERKYFITSQSVETVIKEEIHRMKKASEVPVSETFGSNVEHVKHLTDEHMMQTDGRRIQTVRGYVKNICHKMHVRSRIEAVIKHRAGYS